MPHKGELVKIEGNYNQVAVAMGMETAMINDCIQTPQTIDKFVEDLDKDKNRTVIIDLQNSRNEIKTTLFDLPKEQEEAKKKFTLLNGYTQGDFEGGSILHLASIIGGMEYPGSNTKPLKFAYKNSKNQYCGCAILFIETAETTQYLISIYENTNAAPENRKITLFFTAGLYEEYNKQKPYQKDLSQKYGQPNISKVTQFQDEVKNTLQSKDIWQFIQPILSNPTEDSMKQLRIRIADHDSYDNYYRQYCSISEHMKTEPSIDWKSNYKQYPLDYYHQYFADDIKRLTQTFISHNDSKHAQECYALYFKFKATQQDTAIKQDAYLELAEKIKNNDAQISSFLSNKDTTMAIENFENVVEQEILPKRINENIIGKLKNDEENNRNKIGETGITANITLATTITQQYIGDKNNHSYLIKRYPNPTDPKPSNQINASIRMIKNSQMVSDQKQSTPSSTRVKDMLNSIRDKSTIEIPMTYLALTSSDNTNWFYNRRSQTMDSLLKGVHEYNQSRLEDGKLDYRSFCLLQAISIDRTINKDGSLGAFLGHALGYKPWYSMRRTLCNETTLMAEMSLLRQVDEEPFNTQIKPLYEKYLNKRGSFFGTKYFSKSREGKEARKIIENLKLDWQNITSDEKDTPDTLIKKALQKIMAFDSHFQSKAARLIQVLSTYLTQQTILGGNNPENKDSAMIVNNGQCLYQKELWEQEVSLLNPKATTFTIENPRSGETFTRHDTVKSRLTDTLKTMISSGAKNINTQINSLRHCISNLNENNQNSVQLLESKNNKLTPCDKRLTDYLNPKSDEIETSDQHIMKDLGTKNKVSSQKTNKYTPVPQSESDSLPSSQMIEQTQNNEQEATESDSPNLNTSKSR